MKKLMTTMAALVTGFCVWADGDGATTESLNNVFDASADTVTAETWSTDGFWSGDAAIQKTTFDATNKVLKLETGTEVLSRNIKADKTAWSIGDEGVFFDVELDALGQALDEVPVLPDSAKFALFYLDTTDITDLAEGVKSGLFAIAGDPTALGSKLLLYYGNASAVKAEGNKTRFTIKGYANVLASSNCMGYKVYVDGQSDATVAVDPLLITQAFAIAEDGTVTWTKNVLNAKYQKSLFNGLSKASSNYIALSISDGDADVNGLDFQGNAALAKVVINNDAKVYPFIGADKSSSTAKIGEGVTLLVDDVEYTSSTADQLVLTGDTFIFAKSTDATKPIVKVTAGGENERVEQTTFDEAGSTPEGYTYVFKYKHEAGAEVTFGAVAAGVTATINGTAVSYETLAKLLTSDAFLSATSVDITLNDDATIGNIAPENEVAIVLDLKGKTITGTNESGFDAVIVPNGAFTLKDSSNPQTGHVAVDKNATIGDGFESVAAISINTEAAVSLEGGYIDGAVLVSADITPSISITGGSYLASANTSETDAGNVFALASYLPETGYKAALDADNTYWVVSEKVTQNFTVTFVNAKSTETIDPVSVAEGSALTSDQIPADPAADGFIFQGWFLTDDQGVLADTAFDFTSTISANITLTAKWADVVAKIGDTGYATLQAALEAAADGATVVIAKDCEFADVTILNPETSKSVTIENNYAVTFTTGGSYSFQLDNATVTLKGTGSYTKAAGSASMFRVGATTAGALIVDGGTFIGGVEAEKCEDAPSNLLTVKSGSITVNDGTFVTYRTDQGRCVRAEQISADVKGTATINGGSFTAANVAPDDNAAKTAWCIPVDNKGGLGTVVIPATTDAKFKGNASNIQTIMTPFITKENTDTNDYKFKADADGWYVPTAITYATLTVAEFDSAMVSSVSVTNAAGTVYETGATFDVDDAVVLYADVKLVDGYEIDTANSTLTVTMTANAEIKVVAKAASPAVEPVEPGSETACADQTSADAEAAAINNAKTTMIKVPEIEGINAETFCNLFTATVVTSGEGDAKTYSVKVDLDPTAEGVKAIQAVIDEIAKPDADGAVKLDLTKLATETQKATITAQPGLYYTVYAGEDTPATLDAVKSTQATTATLELEFPKKGTRGFYKIGVSAKEVPVTAAE